MDAFPSLETFGNRIMVCGPSNSGKSTFAVALAHRLGVQVVHLDQLHHVPGSDWVPRPREDFVALHDAAVAGDAWMMDGNYSALFPARRARATGIILLGADRWTSLLRYVRRTLFQRDRRGALEGSRDSIKWKMIHWILIAAPPRQMQWRRTLNDAGLTFLELHDMAELNRLYDAWGLARQ